MFRKQLIHSVAPIAVLLAGLTAQGADYKVDNSHSTIGFSVPHMKISKVNGQFKDFTGTFTFDPAKATVSNGTFVVKTKSVDTAEPKRDDHLRGPDFFDSEKFPEMTFTNSTLKKAGKDKYKWSGTLTIRGVSKPVTFDLVHKGNVKDPWGMNRAGFQATTTIKRKDYGLTWNKALEAGGFVVGEDVTVNLDVEAIEQAAAADAPKTAEAEAAKGVQPAAAKKK